MDYYAILRINRSATEDRIRRNYRVLAQKYHPLRHPEKKDAALRKFRAVAEAYEVLIDPKLRAIYDQFGGEGLKSGVPTANGRLQGGSYVFPPGHEEEVFEKFFGTANPFAVETAVTSLSRPQTPSTPTHSGTPAKLKAAPIRVDVPCTLEELFNGTTKYLKITKQALNADGRTTRTVEKQMKLDIKPGWREGTEITFPEGGDEAPGIIPADVVFIIREKPHEHFKRQGHNLIYASSIPLYKALTGCSVKLTTLDGRELKIAINDIITPSYEKLIKGEGMPIPKSPSQRGDLILRFDIGFPTTLNEHQKELIKTAFTKV